MVSMSTTIFCQQSLFFKVFFHLKNHTKDTECDQIFEILMSQQFASTHSEILEKRGLFSLTFF